MDFRTFTLVIHIGMTMLRTYVAMLIFAKCKLSNAISDKNCAHKTSKFIYLIWSLKKKQLYPGAEE